MQLINENPYLLSGAYVEVTSKCNLRCKHCYNDSGISDGEMSPTAFSNVINCYDGRKSNITISGGEPLMHSKFWELLDMAIASENTHVLIITNATLIDEWAAKEFVKRQAHCSLQVSLNGSCETYHDFLCGKGSFQKTMVGLNNLINAGFENIVCRCMLTDQNKGDIVNAIEYIAALGVKIINIGAMRMSGRVLANQDGLSIPFLELEEILGSLNSNECVEKIKESCQVGFPGAITYGCPLIFHNTKEIPLAPRVDALGQVHLCQSFDDNLYSFGNINDNRIDTICKSDRFALLMNFLYSGINYIQDCKTCIWNTTCGRGCIADLLQNGTIQSTDGLCSARNSYYENQLFATP